MTMISSFCKVEQAMRIKASWDDGAKDDLRIADLMSKYNIPTIFYFSALPTGDKEYLSPDQRRQIAKDFEIGSHTMTHPLLTRIDPERARWEIEESRERLAEEFDQDILSFCYPRGYANPELQQMVVEAGYKSGRSTLVGYIHESENPYFEQTTVHVGCDRKEYAGKDWFEYACHMLDEAIKTPDSVYHLWGHSWEVTKYDGWHSLEKLLERLK